MTGYRLGAPIDPASDGCSSRVDLRVDGPGRVRRRSRRQRRRAVHRDTRRHERRRFRRLPEDEPGWRRSQHLQCRAEPSRWTSTGGVSGCRSARTPACRSTCRGRRIGDRRVPGGRGAHLRRACGAGSPRCHDRGSAARSVAFASAAGPVGAAYPAPRAPPSRPPMRRSWRGDGSPGEIVADLDAARPPLARRTQRRPGEPACWRVRWYRQICTPVRRRGGFSSKRRAARRSGRWTCRRRARSARS